jgi:hypothetical protein
LVVQFDKPTPSFPSRPRPLLTIRRPAMLPPSSRGRPPIGPPRSPASAVHPLRRTSPPAADPVPVPWPPRAKGHAPQLTMTEWSICSLRIHTGSAKGGDSLAVGRDPATGHVREPVRRRRPVQISLVPASGVVGLRHPVRQHRRFRECPRHSTARRRRRSAWR